MDDAGTSQEVAAGAARKLREAEERVCEAVKGVDASVAFASYALYRLCEEGRPESKLRLVPTPAAIEWAAWMLFPEFGRCSCRDAGGVQKVIEAIEGLETARIFAGIFPELSEEACEPRLDVHLRLHSSIVRGSAYPDQIVRRIHGIFVEFEKELSRRVGIGPIRAVALIRALGRQMEDNINGMLDAWQVARKRGLELTSARRQPTEAELAELGQIGETMHRHLEGMEGAWIPGCVQVGKLITGFTTKEWTALRDVFGLTPASRACMTTPMQVQDRPIFFVADDRAFFVHETAALDALFAHFDDVARSDPVLRDSYGRAVASWMECELEGHLRRLFPSESIYRGACFRDPDHEGGEAEADVIVAWGPFLVVAEAKGKRVARSALRGDRTKLKQALRDNVQDAFVQTQRVVRVLERDGVVRFKEKASGRTVEVTRDRLRRVMPISVTLQHLAGVTTQLAVTQQLGLFRGASYPWSVSLDDLDVIMRFSRTPDVLLHYIERRIAHQRTKMAMMGDELDIFGHYLDTRLHPSIYEERKELVEHDGPTFITITGGEERFETYYAPERLGKTPAPPIRLKVPDHVLEVLDELRKRTDDAARWIAFALLGLSASTLDRLDRALVELRQVQAANHPMSRVTFRDGDIVINVLANRQMSRADFRKNVVVRAKIEHYRAKARATATIGLDPRDRSRPFDTALWIEHPWEHDEVMEKFIAEERTKARVLHLMPGTSEPRRNSPCPCGSGKKFKRCCIERITFQRDLAAEKRRDLPPASDPDGGGAPGHV